MKYGFHFFRFDDWVDPGTTLPRLLPRGSYPGYPGVDPVYYPGYPGLPRNYPGVDPGVTTPELPRTDFQCTIF